MNTRARGLEHARRMFRARRYTDVLRILEPQIFRFRTDPTYYALLGLSCLETGEIGGAATYLGRASQLDDQDPEVLIGLAAVHLQRREPEEAVACWLRVLDLDPRNRIARHGLEALRGTGGTVPDSLLESRALRAFLPPVRRRLARPLLVALALVVCLAGAGYGVYRFVEARPSPVRPGVADIDIPSEHPGMLEPTGTFVFTFTEKELRSTFSRAKRYLLEYRDNLAVHELNRILLSNASASIKERARLLRGFAEQPDFSTIRDPFPYEVVKANPKEFVDCHVRWSGRVANVSIGKEQITFDLLVGYQTGRVLQGVVPVAVGFAVSIEDGNGYEVLGRVRIPDSGDMALDAVSIRPIAGTRG
jgi:hypothetical protein